MNFLLDANIYFAALDDPRFLEKHRDDLRRIGPRTFLSSVVRAELLQGARGDFGRARVNRATRSLERVGRVVPPTHDDWVAAGTVQGRIWDDHASLRTKRLLPDILIVCAARRIGAVLVTENKADFDLVREQLPHRALTMSEAGRVARRVTNCPFASGLAPAEGTVRAGSGLLPNGKVLLIVQLTHNNLCV